MAAGPLGPRDVGEQKVPDFEAFCKVQGPSVLLLDAYSSVPGLETASQGTYSQWQEECRAGLNGQSGSVLGTVAFSGVVGRWQGGSTHCEEDRNACSWR